MKKAQGKVNSLGKLKKSALLLMFLILISPVTVLAGGVPCYTPGLRTIKNFLSAAMQPVGSTCYIWGGGWSQNNGKASATAKHIGVCPQWKNFFDAQDSSYDFNHHRIHAKNGSKPPDPQKVSLGLDCGGFVGWVLYNTFHTRSGEGKGYVFAGKRRIKHFVKKKWGSAVKPKKIKNYKAGDILVFHGEHVYISIGERSDGSVVLVHASAPGVLICGTVSRSADEKSEAVALAAEYMGRYYVEYDKKFSGLGYMRNGDYLSKYTQLRWHINGVMADPENYANMNPEQVLKDLFSEKAEEVEVQGGYD